MIGVVTIAHPTRNINALAMAFAYSFRTMRKRKIPNITEPICDTASFGLIQNAKANAAPYIRLYHIGCCSFCPSVRYFNARYSVNVVAGRI